MFCRNCGQHYVTDQAVMCVRCGAKKGLGNGFCPICGQSTPSENVVCLNCGISLAAFGPKGDKSKVVSGLLGIFFGVFGVHNFYLGYTGKAIAQLLITIVSCGILSWVSAIWGFIEGILLLCGQIDRDADGMMLRD